MAAQEIPVVKWPDMHLGEKFRNGVDFSSRLGTLTVQGSPTAVADQGDVTLDNPSGPSHADGIASVWVRPNETGVFWVTVSVTLSDNETVLKARCWFCVTA